ncbi:MAG: pseudouridine synthase [Lachnospiraceae bacterium]|nr:pseudouridine synthase [Lachnospiraceae bacterium]
MRLNKYIAACGICSRREADRLIEYGRIRVNNQIAVSGMQAGEGDIVEIRNKENDQYEKITPDRKVVLAYYKPVGVVCTEKDEHAEIKISDVIDYPVRVTYAGRLDKDSEGLLLLSNDGDLIDAMMRSRNLHEKEYLVRVNRKIDDDFIKKMSSGIYLEEVNIKTRPCRVEKTGEKMFRIVLTQGVNRQIRRMVKALGFYVNSIKRVRVVNITLANLKPNEFREIKGQELQVLYNTVYKPREAR